MSQLTAVSGQANLPVPYQGGRQAFLRPIVPIVRVDTLYERDETPEDPENKPHLRGLLLDMVI